MKQLPEQKLVSPWQLKPWWCQPWSILLTGIILIVSSWLIFNKTWVTLIISTPVLLWMGFFLIIWPKLMLRSDIFHPNEAAIQSYLNKNKTDTQEKA